MENLYVAMLQHRLLNFLMASNCFLITALIQTVHYLCCTRSWYNTVSITSMSRVSEVVRFHVLTTKLNRKAMSVVGGGSLSGLVFKKKHSLHTVPLPHCILSQHHFAIFLPSSHWKDCLLELSCLQSFLNSFLTLLNLDSAQLLNCPLSQMCHCAFLFCLFSNI